MIVLGENNGVLNEIEQHQSRQYVKTSTSIAHASNIANEAPRETRNLTNQERENWTWSESQTEITIVEI